jgi:putative oxidoreductase
MEIGLLILRAVVGLLLAAHGAQKLFGVLGGFGVGGTAGYLESLGLRPGRPLAIAAGGTELIGGLLLAVGFLTPLAAALIGATMLVAALTDHRGKGLWIFNGGAEYVLTVASVAIGLAFSGAGRWSVDAAIGWDVAGVFWGVAAFAAAFVGGVGVLVRRRMPIVATPAPAEVSA